METWYNNLEDVEKEFDLNQPLTDEELVELGYKSPKVKASKELPLIKDLDETEDETVDDVSKFVDSNSYNSQYVHYLKCQSLAALAAFDEGWKSFEELVLKAYVRERKRENADYQGDDPNKAFSLRIRQQTAEDFVKFIRSMIQEAINTPKPTLK
jgi:hypothetical protein